ncbi:UvrD-helicase domain-containing protein [Corynebacterium lizhenjunii]|uniref:UvrD-helicase domain-containing protein n=1 Tax=Corynebacterium lizhenjunii TaxID=2709394 RepID=UPI0013EB3EF7|nr:UvrD-helicase domain-containing protein [Corynebacterium lizhenjunii]
MSLNHSQQPATPGELSPEALAQALGKPFPPTCEQARVISGGLEPTLVVAGAGAGKTETMASRVVYLVANGQVRPEEVLGLTFTRKAARQLEQRIRSQLYALRDSGVLDPDSPAARSLENISVKVMTYDSYAGELVREYGLLVPVEPDSRVITAAEHYALAHEVVSQWEGELIAKETVDTVVQRLLSLSDSLDSVLSNPQDVVEHERDFRMEVANLEKSPRTKGEYSKDLEKYLYTQRLRVQYLPLVAAFKEYKKQLRVTTFGEQMAAAAQVASQHPVVGRQQRARYRAVLLDEYQDTSHAQRVLLRELFGKQHYPELSVTAVGDPMQAIYGWRGATVENLAAFVEDFPTAAGPAPKKQLTTSWRNPERVLKMANAVATDVFGEANRPVEELKPRKDAPAGDIQLGYFATGAQESAFVAQHLRELYLKEEATAQAEGRALKFSAAVLVRTNAHAREFAAALTHYGVPNEIAGLDGLLWQPEVQDLIALATLLVRPQEPAAALRVLAGPLVGLGVADLKALLARAKNLAGAQAQRVAWEPGKDPVEHLREQLAAVTLESPDQVPGLGDAVADLAEKERYSPEGLKRIESLAARLRHLRTYSLGKSIEDVFADIEAQFMVRTEVLARGDGAGTAHLDRFAEEVANFPGHNLGAFVDFVELAREQERGLKMGEVPARADRVQIMTVHKAKGLEFEHVCVVRADSSTYKAQANTFLTNVDKVPGDDDVIDAGDATHRGEFDKACKEFLAADAQAEAEEAARLFYVAITRTETTLTITGSGTNRGRGKNKKGPYFYLEHLRAKYPDAVVHWEVPEEPVEEDAVFIGGGVGTFPALPQRPDAQAGAAQVQTALSQLPPLRAGEVFSQWEQEATALIEEYAALQAPQVDVELPRELTASDMVALRTDAVEFARRQRRPVPFKPNAYAKRGTAFHAWLEQRFGAAALLGEDELPGSGEPLPEATLEELKARFLDSPWAQRTPHAVETPFEITLGGVVVRGRMDAVFEEADGSWLVVDWKTGRKPAPKDLAAAQIQLAVYAQAWKRVQQRLHPEGQPPRVRAAFHYVMSNETYEPEHLPDGAELAALVAQVPLAD